MSDEREVSSVGTVVGVSSTTEFQMQVKPDAIRVQDLVAVDTVEEGATFRVWAKVATIERMCFGAIRCKGTHCATTPPATSRSRTSS